MSKEADRLGWRVRIGFGAGDFAQNLVYVAACMYLPFFYTDVFGLAPTVAAAVFLVAQIADFLWNPLVGAFIDRRSSRWGKYRPYLVFAGLPFVVFAALCFWNPFGSCGGVWKAAYAYATYTGFTLLFTLVNVAYGALNASLSRDTEEIAVLTSVRVFMANAGCFAAAVGVPVLVAWLSGSRDTSWRLALFMGFGFLPSFFLMPLVPSLRRRLGRKGMFYAFVPLAIVGMAAMYALSRIGRMYDSPGLLYAAQVVKASGIIVTTGYMWALVPEVVACSEHLTGRRISGMVNAIMGVFFRTGMAVGRIVPGVVLAWTGYRAGGPREDVALPADPGAWFWTMAALALVAFAVLAFSCSQTRERVVMDAATSAQVGIGEMWREFRRNAPLRILAVFFLFMFTVMSIGNVAGAYFMDGFDMQPPLAQEGIRWLVCVIPTILMVIATAVIARYPLTDDLLDRMNHHMPL